jgi:hypothetical protein
MDLSVAPELAQFAQRSPVSGQAAPPLAAPPLAAPGTLGAHSGALIGLAADPLRWWDRVRFDPAGPVRVSLTGGAWLLVVPPLSAAACDCLLATLVAGEAAEDGAWLRPGRTMVHGRVRPHTVQATAAGYAVSLHVRPEVGCRSHPVG